MVVLGSFIAIVPAPSPVLASPADPGDCDAGVVDTSGMVDVVAVDQAVRGVDTEALVVVRSYDTVADGDLVAAVDELVIDCFSDPSGAVRSDLIVLAVSADDSASDVLVGGRWRDEVTDPEELRIELMEPRFVDEDYTGGLVAALERIADDLAFQPDVGDTETGRSPWSIVGGVGGIAAGGGVFYAVSLYRRLSNDRTQLARQLAGPNARLGALRERSLRLLGQADLRRATTAGRTATRLDELSGQADAGEAESNRNAALLREILPHGPSRAKGAQLTRGRDRAIEFSRALDEQDEFLDALGVFLAHLDHLRVAVPAKVALLDEEIGEALALVDVRAGEGFGVDAPREDLRAVTRVVQELDRIDVDGPEVDLLALSEQVEAAEARLFASTHHLQTLPTRSESLRKWNRELDAAAELELRRIDDLRRQFLVLAGTHASDSWQWAADHPELAVEELDKADAVQDGVVRPLVAEQRFDEAGTELDRAGLHLMEADRLLDQVDDLVVDLDRAQRRAPAVMTEARQIQRELEGLVGRDRPDLAPELADLPARFAAAIAGLDSELRQVKPNFLRVVETGERLNQEMDRVLAKAEEQQTRAEALRRELAREVQRAAGAVARARRSLGWELVPSGDGAALDQLEAGLARLPNDPEQAVAVAVSVTDDALRIQERIIARRRRRSVWVSTGGGGWVPGGGGWSPPGSGGRGGVSMPRSGGGRSLGRRPSGGSRSFGGGRPARRSSSRF